MCFLSAIPEKQETSLHSFVEKCKVSRAQVCSSEVLQFAAVIFYSSLFAGNSFACLAFRRVVIGVILTC